MMMDVGGSSSSSSTSNNQWGTEAPPQLLFEVGTTRLHLARGSVVDFAGDAIVNAANESCLGGGGVDGAVSSSGGERLFRARQQLPIVQAPDVRCPTGDAVVTVAGGSLKCKMVVHAVGPDFRTCGPQSGRLLRSAYVRSLQVAAATGEIKSIGFALLSAGIFRGRAPLLEVLKIGLDACCAWMQTQECAASAISDIFLVGFTAEEMATLQAAWAQVRPVASAVASRASHFITGHKLSYVHRFIAAVQNQYDPEHNPQGQLCMCVAENKLTQDMLGAKLATFPGFSSAAFNYTNPTGLPSLKTALCAFLQANIYRGCTVSPEHLVVIPGVVAALHALATLLFEVGDSVLVPTPFYPAFVHDFQNLGRACVVPVVASLEPSMALTEEALEEAYQSAWRQRAPPKALLITNPSNPLGQAYSEAQLLLAVEWSRKRGLHLIVDEIYALSCFSHLDDSQQQQGSQGSQGPPPSSSSATGPPAYPWHSVRSIVARRPGLDPSHVHSLWSLSKDFGASGFRVGCLHTTSPPLLKALGSFADLMMVSNLTQELVAHVLSDLDWCSGFLEENRRRLRASYKVLVDGLAALPVPLRVLPAESGIFAFVDMRDMIALFKAKAKGAGTGSSTGGTADDWALEDAFLDFLSEGGVVVTPGRDCFVQLAGFARFCYAWVSVGHLCEAVSRLGLLQQRLLAAAE